MKSWRVVIGAAFTFATLSSSVSASADDTSVTQNGQPSAEKRSADSWTTNGDGISLIEKTEGLRLQAYSEGATWRIGYGHSGSVEKGQTITAAEAENLLRSDVHECEIALGRLVKVPVTQNEFSALVSLCYSTGAYAMRSATVIARLNAGDRVAAADAFLMWVNAGGKPSPLLVARRTAERALFLK